MFGDPNETKRDAEKRIASVKLLDQSEDNAPTARGLARGIVKYFRRHYDLGLVLDPCVGDFRWFKWLDPANRAWCEIQRDQYGRVTDRAFGKSCLLYNGPRPKTIMSNPPWKPRDLRPILHWSVATAETYIIFLHPWRTMLTKYRHDLFCDAGFRPRVRILLPKYSNAPDGVPKSDPRHINSFTAGDLLHVVTMWERNWHGPVNEVDWTDAYDRKLVRRRRSVGKLKFWLPNESG